MEYMKINGFLGGAFSKLINKSVENRIGIKPDLKINNLDVSTENNGFGEESLISLNLSMTMTKESFEKLIEAVTE